MSDKKYLVLEQYKFDSSVKDIWSVKFADLNEDKAFEKLVALRSLNEDKERIYYIVNMEYLWSKQDEPLVLTNEVKDNQKDLPF
mgnify:CR=1 FL=1|tara:strand:+ start:18 stop:269 length:252 start_codon:yes stop_codon:yes gene_type:complete